MLVPGVDYSHCPSLFLSIPLICPTSSNKICCHIHFIFTETVQTLFLKADILFIHFKFTMAHSSYSRNVCWTKLLTWRFDHYFPAWIMRINSLNLYFTSIVKQSKANWSPTLDVLRHRIILFHPMRRLGSSKREEKGRAISNTVLSSSLCSIKEGICSVK